MGTIKGIILAYQNEEIINQFNGCDWCDGNSDWLFSILLDQNGYMVTACSNSKLYIFSPNGSFTGQSITTPEHPQKTLKLINFLITQIN